MALPARGRAKMPPTAAGKSPDRKAGSAVVPLAVGTAIAHNATGIFTSCRLSLTGKGSFTGLAVLDQGRVRDLHLTKGSQYRRRNGSSGILELSDAKYDTLRSFGLDREITSPARKAEFLAIINGGNAGGGGSAPVPCPADFAGMSPAQKRWVIEHDQRYRNCEVADGRPGPTRLDVGGLYDGVLDVRDALVGVRPAYAADWSLISFSYEGGVTFSGFEAWYDPGLQTAALRIGGVTAVWWVTDN